MITAKYLPVKGKRYPLVRGNYFKKEGLDVIFYAEIIDGKPHGYPIKLFAVTQDIELKDEVIHLKTFEKSHVGKGGIWINPENNWVKVLGELSPDAIWVKDGDEIEIELVSRGVLRPDGEPIKSEYGTSQPMKIIQEVEVDIKCPTCKTYH